MLKINFGKKKEKPPPISLVFKVATLCAEENTRTHNARTIKNRTKRADMSGTPRGAEKTQVSARLVPVQDSFCSPTVNI